MRTQVNTQFILGSLLISNQTSFYLCAFFIISSPPSRKDFISLGIEDSPAHKSTTLPPSLVSTPTLRLPPSTNWTRRMVCLNRLSIQPCIRSGRIPSKCRNIKLSNTIQSSSVVWCAVKRDDSSTWSCKTSLIVSWPSGPKVSLESWPGGLSESERKY